MRVCIFAFTTFLLASLAHAQPTASSPADDADKVARSAGGKLVRIVGSNYDRQATPSTTSLGDTVEVTKDDFTMNSLCHVLLKGLPVTDGESGKEVPFIPELFDAFGDSPASWPVELQGSCRGDGCFYSVLLKAEDCLKAADADGYQASTMKEMISLYPANLAERGRFLWSTGICVHPETAAKYDCSLPLNDITIIPGRNVKVMHGFAGRDGDLNFAKSKGGVIQPREK